MYTFPALTTEEKALLAAGSLVPAIRAYHKRARVSLPNGHEVGPTLKTAKDVVYLTAEGLDIPVIVSEGSYVDYTEISAAGGA